MAAPLGKTVRRTNRWLIRLLTKHRPPDRAGVDGLVGALEALRNPGMPAMALLLAGLRGRVWERHWLAMTGEIVGSLGEIEIRIADLWRIGRQRGWLPGSVVYRPRAPMETWIFRWARWPGWLISSQDEDLLLMRPEIVPILFRTLHFRQWPKYDYILEIIGHHARDHAHWALTQPAAGPAALREALERAGSWANHARTVGAPKLGEYLDRLGSYAKIGPVDEEGVRARLRDIARCNPPSEEMIVVGQEEGAFTGHLQAGALGSYPFRVDAGTGRMSVGDRQSPS